MTDAPRKAVVLGGGCGVTQVIQGLRAEGRWDLTAIVAVTDTGRSTGRARALAGIPAPGDLRNVLAELAPATNPWPALLQHRLDLPRSAELDGMALGNLALVALHQMTGDFAAAVERLREMLGVEPVVLPVSDADTELAAELADGRVVTGEVAVRALGKPPIRRVFIADGGARALPQATSALAAAELVVLGPGSLFTTVLACLAFPGIVEAIRGSGAVTVFVCNTTNQPGQTDGLGIVEHVWPVAEALGPGGLGHVVLNAGRPSPEREAALAAEGLQVLVPDAAALRGIEALGTRPWVEDLAERAAEGRALWNKQDTIRHDPAALGALLGRIWQSQVRHDTSAEEGGSHA